MMDKVHALISRQSVILGIYGISLGLMVVAVYKISASLSTSQFLSVLAISVIAISLPFLVIWINYRGLLQLLLGSADIAAQCLQGDVEIAEIRTPLKHTVTDRFTDQYNQFVAKVVSSFILFGDVAVRLAEDAQDISSRSEHIAQSMQQQASDTGQLQAIIDGLQAAISVARGGAQTTHQLANQSEAEGESGKQVMTEAITGVMMLSASVNEAGEIIRKLGEDSKSIGGIIEVITGVSEQTNLLALNAAIEAARAGEQGRGFAVVADEVRTLAGQTQQSAQKINDIINVLLGHVTEASSVINNSVEQADKSDELMEGVAISYSELVGYMKEISAQSSSLQEAMVDSLSSADTAVSNLVSIQSSSQETIEQTEVLITDGMELGKMGEQLSLMVGGSVSIEVKKTANKADNSNRTDDSIELF